MKNNNSNNSTVSTCQVLLWVDPGVTALNGKIKASASMEVAFWWERQVTISSVIPLPDILITLPIPLIVFISEMKNHGGG